ncbi:ATP-binding cassette domain-containing protein [Marinilabiliaceae bacterium ANBcel2]|nr:ATP-binding cassette domain-containing protein [Marinilabiliaceae bacterium ANBcel2]
MSISASKVTRFYGRQQALNNVSFDVAPGEVVGFLGPNGAGKSTMMKIITGYLPASKGEISVCNLDITKNSTNFKLKTGYLPEHNPLYNDMYITEYLKFTGSLYNLKNINKRIEELIDITGLTPERHKKIGKLSKGFKQRVGLAQALLPDPEVLILDEPTTGLDPNQIIGIRKLIKELGKHKTILLSTHIMQEVKAICERVIIIDKGAIIANELTENIESTLKEGGGQIEVEFNKNPQQKELLKIEGVENATLNEDNKWIISSFTNVDPREKLFKFAVEHNLIITGMNKKEHSLEDIFHKLTADNNE